MHYTCGMPLAQPVTVAMDVDYATLHQWSWRPKAARRRAQGRFERVIGTRQAPVDGRIILPFPPSRRLYCYPVLWRAGQAMCWLEPQWMEPGGQFVIAPVPAPCVLTPA